MMGARRKVCGKIMLLRQLCPQSLTLPLLALLFAAPGLASEIRARNIGAKLPAANTGEELESYTYSSHKGEVKSSIQCLGGYKFALVSALGHSAAPEPAVTMIQVYEDLKGRVVPAKC